MNLILESKLAAATSLASGGVMFAIGDTVWNGVIAGVVAVVLAWMNLRIGRIAGVTDKTAMVAEKTAAVAEKTAVVAEKTHILVNSNMGVQLKIAAVALRRIAFMTSNLDDSKAAEIAENLLKEHEVKQSTVDRLDPKPAT